jgi:hypothetical protein
MASSTDNLAVAWSADRPYTILLKVTHHKKHCLLAGTFLFNFRAFEWDMALLSTMPA